MKLTKQQTETYRITELPDLDPITVYVTNYAQGQGKLVIECWGDAWAHYWGAMGPHTLQEFVLSAENDYLLGKLLKETMQTDFDEINELAAKKGYDDICVSSDAEIAMIREDMAECFGEDWYMDLPRCHTDEYTCLHRILQWVKSAFQSEAPKPKG